MVSNVPQEPATTVIIIRGGKQKFRKRQLCKTCQEIGHKEEEAAKRWKWHFPMVRTKLKLGEGQGRHGLCKLHAKMAGRSKDKLFDKAGKIENKHQQKELPFKVLKKIKMDEVPRASSSSSIHSTRR
jgi:hypothetical protein